MDSGSLALIDSKRVDVPMRSFFPEYYPFLRNLYDQVGIPYAQTDNSMSFATIEDGAVDPSLIYQHENSFPINCRMDEKMEKSEVNEEIKPYFSFTCHDTGSDNLYSLPDLPAFEFSWDYAKKLGIIACVIVDYFRLLLLAKFLLALGFLEQGMFIYFLILKLVRKDQGTDPRDEYRPIFRTILFHKSICYGYFSSPFLF
jgi:hypothetical protein